MASLATRDVLAALIVAPFVEWGRRFRGPGVIVQRVRRWGQRQARRDTAARLRLRRAIRLVDRFVVPWQPRGNCYRRALMEMAMDAGAAAEPLRIGLQAAARPGSGHAWLGDEENSERYVAILSLYS